MAITNCRVCGRELFAEYSVEIGVGPICAGHLALKSGRCEQRDMFAADFDWYIRRGALVIVDLCLGSRSVTNDAEQVIEHIAALNPAAVALPIIYRDSEGCFDELVPPRSPGGRAGLRSIGLYNLDLAIDAAIERRRVEGQK